MFLDASRLLGQCWTTSNETHASIVNGQRLPLKVRCAFAIKRLDFDGMSGRLDIDSRAQIGSVEFHHVPTYIHGEPSLADENDLEHVYSMSDAFLTLVMMGGS